jgi:hypothetical protein
MRAVLRQRRGPVSEDAPSALSGAKETSLGGRCTLMDAWYVLCTLYLGFAPERPAAALPPPRPGHPFGAPAVMDSALGFQDVGTQVDRNAPAQKAREETAKMEEGPSLRMEGSRSPGWPGCPGCPGRGTRASGQIISTSACSNSGKGYDATDSPRPFPLRVLLKNPFSLLCCLAFSCVCRFPVAPPRRSFLHLPPAVRFSVEGSCRSLSLPLILESSVLTA